MKGDIGVVLIHGAGLGSFIWDEIKPMINYHVLAIDFPNRNKSDKSNLNLTFHAYSKETIDQIEDWNKRKFIMVAHSIGGCIALQIATHFKDRLSAFVALSAAIPENKKSFASCLPFPQKYLMPLMLNIFGTKPPEKIIKNDLCNDLTQQQTKKIITYFTPEAKQLYTKKINYEPIEVEKLYIKLTNDKSFSLSAQNKMAINLKADNIQAIESGHLVMLSHPKELAGILNSFIARTMNR